MSMKYRYCSTSPTSLLFVSPIPHLSPAKTLDPSLGTSSRRSMASPPDPAIPVPSPLSSRLGAAAVEHPCFTLQNWWLVRVEGTERKIAVSGFTQRDDAFTSAPITKRHEPLVLEDEDGVVVRIDGLMSLCRMRQNGFSLQICENFLTGFPSWWESWDSHFESQPTSSSNSQEDSTQMYLKFFQLGSVVKKSVASFIKNPLHDAKDFRRYVADAFAQYSKFDEYSIDNDTSTKEKTAASNDASEGPAAVANAVDNMEIDLIVSSTSQERGHVDISCNASAPTENCTSDETYNEAENQNDTMHPDATEKEAGSHPVNSDLMCNRSPDCMPSDLEDGNTNAGNSTDVALCHLATVQPERTNCCSEIAGGLQNIQPLSYERNTAASLKNQGHLKRTEGISLNHKAVPSEDTSTSVSSHVQSLEKAVDPSKKERSARDILLSPTRLPGTRILISYAHDSPLTRRRAQSLSISTPESLKMKRTKSGRVVVPPLDLGCDRILYDNNHLVLGVAPVELHSPLIKGSKPGTPARKRRAR